MCFFWLSVITGDLVVGVVVAASGYEWETRCSRGGGDDECGRATHRVDATIARVGRTLKTEDECTRQLFCLLPKNALDDTFNDTYNRIRWTTNSYVPGY